MKRILLSLVLLFTLTLLFATGKIEIIPEAAAQPEKITILGNMLSGQPLGNVLTAEAKKANIDITFIEEDITTGSTISMDALIAAGKTPEIYNAFIGRACKYMVTEFALPLNRFADRVKANYLGAFYRGEDLLGIPLDVSNQGLCVNLDMLDSIGYALPADGNITVDQFLEICELVKQKLPGVYGTALFAKSQSADYLYMNWFASFGAEMFKKGDYSRVTINSPAGVETAAFFRLLYKKGYVPPDSPTLVDDNAVLLFWTGKVAMFAEYPGWEANLQAALDQKLIDKAFRYKLIRFPAGRGVTTVPASFQGGCIVASKARPGVTYKMIDLWLRPEIYYRANARSSQGAIYSSALEMDLPWNVSPLMAQAMKIAADNGLWDQGITQEKFSEMRKCWFPIFAELMRGTVDPYPAMAAYEAALTRVLAK